MIFHPGVILPYKHLFKNNHRNLAFFICLEAENTSVLHLDKNLGLE